MRRLTLSSCSVLCSLLGALPLWAEQAKPKVIQDGDGLTVDPSGSICRLIDKHRVQGRNVFRLLDKSRDGYLQKKEIEGFLHRYTDGVMAFDADQDGKLAVHEVRAGAKQADKRVHFAGRPRSVSESDADGADQDGKAGKEAGQQGHDLSPAHGSGSGRYRAWAAFGQQHAFIGDYDISGSGNPDPVISVLNTGSMIALGEIVIYQR